MNRRQFILAGVTMGVAGVLLKPENNGAPYAPYFNLLNESLKNQGNYLPSMLVDLDILDENIKTLSTLMKGKIDYRIVAKSLPSPELLGYVMEKSATNKLMVFHQPFLTKIANDYPKSDILMGKPMPVKAAKSFYQLQPTNSSFKSDKQLQWLIDSEERLKQYLDLAISEEQRLQINIEIDIGLHRGGLQNTQELDVLLNIIEDNPAYLKFSGFMGYDPHVVKIPSIVKSTEEAYLESQEIYQRFITHLYNVYPHYKEQVLCFNGAGSPTLALHVKSTVANEVSAGSCLVKPIDFDIPSLSKFKAAAFIATPVLKKMKGTTLPAAEFAQNILPMWDSNMEQTFFIYGGKWLAKYESPNGLQDNGLFGSSTNQAIVNGSNRVNIDVDDHVFLRPMQSEFVFLQFGSLLTLRNYKISNQWPILQQS